MSTEFEAVIGLEVHCQLATDSKIFCSCPARMEEGCSVADMEMNANTCVVCAGHPGTLPVLNQKVVEYAVMAGLATHCQINPRSVFARKNYFYPDLPKGYQISQMESPICLSGWIDVSVPSNPQTDSQAGGEFVTKRIGIQRIHIEEDAGKNMHLSGYSVVNLNRAGVPLVEIVTDPVMKSPAEAGAYLRALYGIVTYLGICDGNLQEGNFRCDANVSVMPKGSKTFGTRTEIKNLNSFRFVEKAIDYEIRRQQDVILLGGRVIQETRSYDSNKNTTASMRSKEEAQDYRYFPDPDLLPVHLDSKWIESLKSNLPELPEQKRNRWTKDFNLSIYDAETLASSKSMARFFEQVLTLDPSPELAKPVANWLTGEVSRLLNEAGMEVSQSRLTPAQICDLVRLVQKQVLSSTGAKRVLSVLWEGTDQTVAEIVKSEGLEQVSEVGALDPIIDQVVAAFPKQVAEYRSGKDKLLGFFVGQAMKQMGGKANPALLGELFKKKLS